MAERTQLQYQPVTGPVWSEPVASRLAWLPSVQQPGRSLPPNRLGDYVRPEFAALYDPRRLEWIPSDRYYGRAIAASPKLFQGFALVGPSAFDPRNFDWAPRGQPPARGLPPNRLGDFARSEFEALYKSERLEWIPSDRYAGRSFARSAYDSSVLVQLVTTPSFDPQTLDWMPRGTAPQIPLERRRLGDFQQPSFSTLYDPQRLEWTPSDRYAGRGLPRALNDQSVLVQLVVTAVFDPQNLDWQPRDRYFGRPPARALVDWSVLQGEPIIAPPAPVVPPVADTAGGGSGVASWPVQDKYWRQLDQRYKKKKKQAEKKSPEAVEIVEDIASRQASLAAALEVLTEELQHARIREAVVYRDLLKLEFERKRHEEDMDDEDVILLMLH